MSISNNHIIAIQIRTGATRLPGKMSTPFYGQKTIPELLIEHLLAAFPSDRIVVATSTAEDDDLIHELAIRLGVRCSRGSENDVLLRVVDAVRDDAAEYVVRVCGDNPFLRSEFIEQLGRLASESGACESKAEESKAGDLQIGNVQTSDGERGAYDYASFSLADGTPTILSHLGLFAEVIFKSTLERIEKTAASPRHREHLTSHILDHPEMYRRRLLPLPACLATLQDLRLTVDTAADFAVCQELYADTVEQDGRDFTVEQLVERIKQRSDLRQTMAEQILANEKR